MPFELHDSLNTVDVTSRNGPSASIVVAPVQLTSLKPSTTSDPVLTRLSKNGFANNSINSRPASAANNKSDDGDVKFLNSALETERKRLLDLVKNLQKRLDQSQSQIVERETKFVEQKSQNLRLEKEIERLKSELNNVKNRTGSL